MGGSPLTDLQIEWPELPANAKCWLAFSGGLDSTTLLQLLATTSGLPVTAVHIDHGLQPSSADWSRHCGAFARQLGVEFISLQVTVDNADELGVEAAARAARYAALKSLIGPGDILLTAHHQNDQAETLLIQLLRGSGPHGLAAMPKETPFGEGRLIRPLLDTSRDDIEKYATAHELTWIEDPSNADAQYRRNYLRRKVMPVIAECWPQYTDALERSSLLQAEAASLLDDLAEQDRQQCTGRYDYCLSIPALLELSSERRRNVLRFWVRKLGFPLPSHAHIRRIEIDMFGAKADANPVVAWGNTELHRFREELVIMSRLPAVPADKPLLWDLQNPIELPAGCGWLEAECAQGAGLRLETPRLELRFNQPGERIQPVFSKHHKRLKHLFQENAVPPWVRERLPLIYHGQNLAAVADCWIAAEYAARQDEQGWLIHWRDAPVGWIAPDRC